MIIGKDFEGISDHGYYYEYQGTIKAEAVKIRIPLGISGWLQVREQLGVSGIETKNLYLLHGTFSYNIWIFDNHIKIGCVTKTKKEWERIDTKKKAIQLGDDGSMWEARGLLTILLKAYKKYFAEDSQIVNRKGKV